ncbi:MAG: NYN domain-containing protein [Aureliella sp.]
MPNKTSPINSIALLIDADNAPAAKIEFIISELATYGIVNIRTAYGNWTNRTLVSWIKVLHEYAIAPKQYFDLVKGKNATDMAMLIDAMDLFEIKRSKQSGHASVRLRPKSL